LLQTLEHIRQVAAARMGLASGSPEPVIPASVPKIAVVSGPRTCFTLSGRQVQEAECDITARMISMGQPHRAIPVTGALCLAVASKVAGSVPHSLARSGAAPMRIAHPSGTLVVDADIDTSDTVPQVRSATFYRTARRLFDGHVWFDAVG
jgi:hypothetical protein